MGQRTELPTEVWQWIDHVLPGVKRQVIRPAGGYSDGVRGRLDGYSWSAFVKALPISNPSIEDERIEVALLSGLPETVGSPQLLASVELGGWFIALTEFIDGASPSEPWGRDDLARVIRHIDAIQPELRATEIGRSLPTVTDRMRGRATTWNSLLQFGATRYLTREDLSDWELGNLARLALMEQKESDLSGDDIVHFDLRADNLLIEPEGRIRILDWGRASRGPAWVDIVCLLLESPTTAQHLEPLFQSSAASNQADDSAVDTLLVILLSYWREAAEQTEGVTPVLQERRKRSAAATRRWLTERWETHSS